MNLKSYIESIFWGSHDRKTFVQGMQTAINTLDPFGVFFGDNLFTFRRNLSFLDMPKFMEAFNKHATDPVEKAIIWRVYLLCWAAEVGLRREGDFVECGCYRGTSARIMVDFLDFAKVDKQFYIYDLFEHTGEVAKLEITMPDHGADLHDKVKQRFADLNNFHCIKGRVPEILLERSPEKIAFLHIDMNFAAAEVGALEMLFDRVSPGAVIVFDDYGWLGSRPQKLAEDNWLAARGYRVLELPTGQGMVIK